MRVLLPVALIASIAVPSIAMAASTMATGTIKSMDAKACTVTLADKAVYQFPAKCDFSALKVGEKVNIDYSLSGKTNNATTIVAAK